MSTSSTSSSTQSLDSFNSDTYSFSYPLSMGGATQEAPYLACPPAESYNIAFSNSNLHLVHHSCAVGNPAQPQRQYTISTADGKTVTVVIFTDQYLAVYSNGTEYFALITNTGMTAAQLTQAEADGRVVIEHMRIAY